MIVKKIALALVFFYTYFSPTVVPILTVGFFIVMDALLAILVCIRTGEAIRSRKLYRTAAKFAASGIIILVAHVMCKQYFNTVPGVEIATGYLVLVEIKSIDEKAEKIYGVSMFKWVLDRLKIRNEKLDK